MALKALRSDYIRKWLPLATLALLILLVGIAQPSFLQPSTLIGLARAIADRIESRAAGRASQAYLLFDLNFLP
jgi:hypothetical protein